jgi:hypothetical protein
MYFLPAFHQKPHKATGPDEIPAFILRSAAQQLAPILTQIYRHSLDIGAVPQDWRDAWKIGASCCAADLSINAGTSSGPVALCGFWFFNSL